MPIRSPTPTSRPAATSRNAAEIPLEATSAALVTPESEAPAAHRNRTADPRLAALQSIQASRRTPPPAADPPAPEFRELVDTLVAPHSWLCSDKPLTGQQCFDFVKASTLSFGRCTELLDSMLQAMPDGSLRRTIRALKQACAVFSEDMPVKRWDVQARYQQALELADKKLPPMFVLTQDFGQWLFRNFAAIQALLGVANAAHELPDERPDRAAFLTVASQTAQLKFAHALQETTQQLSHMLEQYAMVFNSLAVEMQEKIITRPSCRLAMDALNIMSLPQRNLLHVCDELEQLVKVTSDALRFLTHGNHDDPDFNERIAIIAMQTRAYSRRSKACAALNAHRRMLNYVRLGTSDLKGSLMEEMRQTLDRIEETQHQIEKFNDMQGEFRNVGGQVYLALFEHVEAHSHDIEIDLRHLGARLGAADGSLLMANRLVGDMMDQIADDMHEMRHAVGEMAIIEKRRLVRTALNDDEQARFETLLVSMFPLKPVEVIDDPEPAPSSSAATVGTSQPVPPLMPDQRSLDELMAFINVEPTGSKSKRSKQKAPSKNAASGQLTRASADSPGPSAVTPDPALLDAYAQVDESAEKLPYLKKGALLSAAWRAQRVRDELAGESDRPMSATRVYRRLQVAVNVLEEKSSEAAAQILILDRAASAVAELESDPQIKIKRGSQIATMRSQWQSQRAELDRKAGLLRAEAVNRQRIQVFNVFMAYPCLENFRLLKRDPDVAISARRTCVRKPLAEMTVSGFQKPHQDYLDVYQLKLQMKGLDGLPARKGVVEFHAHFRGAGDDALPTAAHFKNLEQSVAAGEGIHRGLVATHELAAVIGQIGQSVR